MTDGFHSTNTRLTKISENRSLDTSVFQRVKGDKLRAFDEMVRKNKGIYDTATELGMTEYQMLDRSL